MKIDLQMKKFFVLAGMLLSVACFSQTTNGDAIVSALKTGDAAQFSSYFDNFVDIKLPEKDEIKNVGKTQASVTIKSFFSESSIAGFDETSRRELSGTMYLTGKLKGASKDYNITLMMKNKNDKMQIITIRIN